MVDLHRLRLLRELQHRGTLAAVAAALSYAPSTVSQQLSQLEAEIGVPLLEPVGRRVRLTPQAEILVAHTEAVLERLEQAEAEIAGSLREPSGTVRVASFQTAWLDVVPTALGLLRDRHPLLRMHVRQMQPELALSALRVRDVDLVITEEYPGHPQARTADLEQHTLHRDPLHLAVPPAWPNGGDGAEALRRQAERPWVMEPMDMPVRQWAVALCREAGFEPDVRYETTDVLLHLRLVEQGHAVALLPDLVWHGRPPTVALHRLPRGHRARRLLTVVRRGRSRHPAVDACRQALHQAVAVRTASAPGRTDADRAVRPEETP